MFTCAPRCCPTSLLLAAHQSTGKTWRDGEIRERFAHPHGRRVSSRTFIPAHRFSSFLKTRTHSLERSGQRAVAHPSHAHLMTLSFSPRELSVSSICVTHVLRKVGVSLGDRGCCWFRAMRMSHPGRHNVLHRGLGTPASQAGTVPPT